MSSSATASAASTQAEQALVSRYATAIAPIANAVVGRLTENAATDPDDGESAAANLIADSMLAATRAKENGAAQLALVNATGVRVTLPARRRPLQGCVRDDAVREQPARA